MKVLLGVVVATAALLAAVHRGAGLPLEYECSLDSRSLWRGYEGNQLDANDFQAFMELVGAGGGGGGGKAARAAVDTPQEEEPEQVSCSRPEETIAQPEPCAAPHHRSRAASRGA